MGNEPGRRWQHDAIDDLVLRLGGLPLALEHAGAHVAKNPAQRFANYLTRYTGGGFGADPMFATWQISIEDAGTAAPLAPRIMAALAFCAPDAVPEVLFRSVAEASIVYEHAIHIAANLAISYGSAGRVTEAIAFMEDAITHATTLGFEHLNVEDWRTALARWQAATQTPD